MGQIVRKKQKKTQNFGDETLLEDSHLKTEKKVGRCTEMKGNLSCMK